MKRTNVPLTQQIKMRVRRSRLAQRAVGRETRDRILEFMRQRVLAGNLSGASYRDIMQACGVSSTSVVNYHMRVLEKEGKITRVPGIARSAFIPGYTDALVTGLDDPNTSTEFIRTRDALLAYFIKTGEDGLYTHWLRRCVAWDEIPNLAEALANHALRER